MLTIDQAHQFAADGQRALRASAHRTHPIHRIQPTRPHPVRRLLEWLDRTTPAEGAVRRIPSAGTPTPSSTRRTVLSAWCPAHEARVLVTPSQIHAIEATAGTMVVRFRCTCGAVGSEPIARRRRAGDRTQVATP